MRSMVLLAACLLGAAAAAQQSTPLLALDFDRDTSGVFSADRQGVLGTTSKPEQVFKGAGSLEFRFMQRAVQPGAAEMPGALGLPLPQPYPDMRGISFALYTELPAAVVVAVSEGEGGPSYHRILWSEGGEWQEFTLPLRDFCLDQDSGPDPDGQLNPEKITGIMFLDVDTFLRSTAEAATFIHMNPPEEQVIRLDELHLLPEELTPSAPPAPEGVIPIVSYELPLAGVAFVSFVRLTAANEVTEDGHKTLKLDYTAAPQTAFVVLHQVRTGALKDMKSLQFRVKSSGKVTLLVGLEEKRGKGDVNKSSYQAFVEVDAAQPWKTVSLPLSAFQLEESSSDPDGKLNPELVDMVSIADLSALGSGTDLSNLLWLDNLVGNR